ncbi:hypothetical protein BOX15_Mlig026735g1, partial [Macrostomum lignano]
SIYDLTVPLDYYSGRMKGYAFVHYNHSSDAKEAHKRLDGTNFLGRAIEIEFARGQRRTPAEMMRMERMEGSGRDTGGTRRRSRSHSRSRGRSGHRRSSASPAAKSSKSSISGDKQKPRNSLSTSRRSRRSPPQSPLPSPNCRQARRSNEKSSSSSRGSR